MATELVIKAWCDPCLEAGENVPGETVTVAVGVVRPFDVEVCPAHAKPLAEAVTALAAYGRSPGKTVPLGPAGASTGNVGPRGGKRDQQGGTGGTCPVCGHVNRTRAALRSHLRRQHDKSLADVGLAEATHVCPDCGGKFDAGQGLSAHVRLTHGAGAKQSA